jgi:hypothetical protein
MNFLYEDTTIFYIKTNPTPCLTGLIRASTIRIRVLARLTHNGKAQVSKRRNKGRCDDRPSP